LPADRRAARQKNGVSSGRALASGRIAIPDEARDGIPVVSEIRPAVREYTKQ